MSHLLLVGEIDSLSCEFALQALNNSLIKSLTILLRRNLLSEYHKKDYQINLSHPKLSLVLYDFDKGQIKIDEKEWSVCLGKLDHLFYLAYGIIRFDEHTDEQYAENFIVIERVLDSVRHKDNVQFHFLSSCFTRQVHSLFVTDFDANNSPRLFSFPFFEYQNRALEQFKQRLSADQMTVYGASHIIDINQVNESSDCSLVQHFLSKLIQYKPRYLPFYRNGFLDIVTADYVVMALLEIGLNQSVLSHKYYNIVSGHKNGVYLNDLVSLIANATQSLEIKSIHPVFKDIYRIQPMKINKRMPRFIFSQLSEQHCFDGTLVWRALYEKNKHLSDMKGLIEAYLHKRFERSCASNPVMLSR